ncbi:Ger(x)C family spore germination protein [Bacillus sp. ISL-7]|uniref:Ger(x)C family spore germination protein n=1 Tax=Bacillus sp. ISL-7 TaxID=2819136 RepID=UPI001BECEC11|nr:Ger(x)C family spore germination protein [Bacillus sp. ISL-7]MBT2736390.1 Ger(x)C family spore germination protein [Bacillus sp. ISL-7]
MKIRKLLWMKFITFLCLILITGCWNYREIDKLAIVAGVAIDKDKNGQYLITAEIVQINSGMEAQSTQITMQGKTIFDAVRNEISLSGSKLYWSHTKAVIISKDIAEEGILRIVDWFNWDSETRADLNLLVSREKTAREVLVGQGVTENIKSFEIDEMLKNEKSLSKAPVTEIWKFINDLEAPGIVAVLPTIKFKKSNQQKLPQLMGTAMFKKDKLIGFLNPDLTKDMLFVKDEVKGGLIVVGGKEKAIKTPLSLEIFKNETKVEPVFQNQDITFNIKIKTRVALDEFEGRENYTDEEVLKKLESNVEKELKRKVENCIKTVQSEYGVDIFGFGAKIREENPRKWNEIAINWENKFKDVKVHVTTSVHIKGSGMLADPLEMGD